MTFWNFTRSPASIKLLLDFGFSRRLSAAQLLAGTRLTSAQLGDTTVSVSAGQELTVIENLLRLRPLEADIGLQIGLTYHASAYGVFGLGMMSCATGMHALQLAQRFLPLTYAYVSIDFHQNRDDLTLLFEAPSTLSHEVQQFVVERAMGATARVIEDVIGLDAELSEFQLSFRDPSASATLPPKTVLGVKVHWGREKNKLSIPLRVLNRSLVMANSTTAAMCERMCEDLVKRRRSQLTTTTLVREYLATLPDDTVPKLRDIANVLNTSERTLKRWFQRDGVTYRELLGDSRQAKANRLLANPEISLTEAAARLGFSDLSSFSQAYKRWTGKSPRYSFAKRR